MKIVTMVISASLSVAALILNATIDPHKPTNRCLQVLMTKYFTGCI